MKAILITMVIAISIFGFGAPSAFAALFPAPIQPTTTTSAPAPQTTIHHIATIIPITTQANTTSTPPAQTQPAISSNDLNAIISYGGTLVGGGVLGFAVGYALKKVVKIILIVLGLFIAGLAFLQYRGWIHVDWTVVQTQTNDLAKQGANQLAATINTASSGLHTTHLDILYPMFGIGSFTGGLCLGFIRG